MSLFNALSDLGNLINDTVGNNMNNDEDDVIKTKENFARIGRYAEPVENGIIDQPLDNAIRGFQRDNDLKQDGFMNPRGETEQTLHREIAQTEIDTDAPPLQQSQNSHINTINKRAVFEKLVETMANPLASPLEQEPNDVQIAQAADNNAVPKPERKPQQQQEERKKTNMQTPLTFDATGQMKRPEEDADQQSSNTPPLPQRKPEKAHHTKETTAKGLEKRLLDFIGNLESSDNYNIIAGGKEKPLTTMTVKEVRQFQRDLQNQGAGSTALGRYQIKDDTLDYLIRRMKLDKDVIFDEKMQDRMAIELLKRRGLVRFKKGDMTTERYIYNLSQEWAALPENSSNESFHKGVGNNKALVDFKTMKDLLDN